MIHVFILGFIGASFGDFIELLIPGYMTRVIEYKGTPRDWTWSVITIITYLMFMLMTIKILVSPSFMLIPKLIIGTYVIRSIWLYKESSRKIKLGKLKITDPRSKMSIARALAIDVLFWGAALATTVLL